MSDTSDKKACHFFILSLGKGFVYASHFINFLIYNIGTAENHRQFEEAMKNGHVKAWLCKLLMYGHAGSGKSTTMEIIVGNKPPEYRESTPLATRPTTIYRVNLESEEWAKLSTLNDCKLLLARALICDVPELVDHLLATQSKQVSANISLTPSKVESQVKIKGTVISGWNHSELPVQGKPLLVSAEGGALDSSELDSSDEDIEVEADAILESISTDQELVKLMDQLSTSIDPLTAFRILELIDCGGQPQFHEILPVFLRRLDFYVFVFRLCDELDSRPLIEFFVDGEPVGVPYESSQTVEQLLQHCARNMYTHRSVSGGEGECPKIMVIGTHADLEGKSKESREQKNEKILKLLLPNLEKQIIYHDVPSKQIVFPLNALNPGHKEERIIKNIRNLLLRSSSVPPVDIPLRWFAFEILLKQMTGALQQGVLSREECFITAKKKLHFENDAAEFDAAIQYLHNLSVLFYYHEILPEVIFADPQVIYDKVSELVLAHHKMSTDPEAQASTDDWCKFYEFALVTAEFLSQREFSKHYVPGLFEIQHLIELFKKLLIFAVLDGTNLFVPALLHELSKKEIDKRCTSSEFLIPTLVLAFPDGGPQKGIFCSLLCWLVSHMNSHWSIKVNDIKSPSCLFRNCIQLDHSDFPTTLTLVDTYTHFEVHVNIDVSTKEEFDELCPTIFAEVYRVMFEGIHRAILNLNYPILTLKAALLCPCGKGDTHSAAINLTSKFWKCSVTGKGGKLTPLQLLWFINQSSTSCATADIQHLTEHHLSILISALKSHASKWMEIGTHLGFRHGNLLNIATNPLLLTNAPRSWLQAMLSEWLQRAPGDTRGSPSLDSLKSALNKCDLGATASDLAAQLRF